MKMPFELTDSQLLDIAHALEDRIKQGLMNENQEVQCLLTYVPAAEKLKSTRAIVLDLGGTNARSATLHMRGNQLAIDKGPFEALLPLKRGIPLAKETFLDAQVDLIRKLHPETGLPLGYCFSYPMRSTFDGDAELLHWTKEVFVPETVGHHVGKMLMDRLATDDFNCKHIVVINDAIASLFAGLSLDAVDAYIGLIVGTGTNMALFIDSSHVAKLPVGLSWSGDIPVNLESGNFIPPHLTQYDSIVDAQSENPGRQLFEKAVSGAYLGRILKAFFPNSSFDPDSGSRGVVALAHESNESDQTSIVAREILKRSARLVAASLAGTLNLIASTRSIRRARIVAEGSLFWKAPGYSSEVRQTLESLLINMNLPDVTLDIVKVANANLIGSAIATLVK